MSNRLSRGPAKPVQSISSPRILTKPLPANPPSTPAVPRSWIYGSLAAILGLAMLVGAFSMWVILHKR